MFSERDKSTSVERRVWVTFTGLLGFVRCMPTRAETPEFLAGACTSSLLLWFGW
jgi:hypothetical protein